MADMESNPMTKSAIAQTRALWRVWSECPQPATRRLADLIAPVQGSTLPTSGLAMSSSAGFAGQIAFPQAGVKGITTFRARTTVSDLVDNYMDVSPFRSGGPPV
jgi:hypothetical protein